LGIAVVPGLTGAGTRLSDFYLSTLGPTQQRGNAVLYYVLTYGLTTIGAFGVVGVVERATGSDKFDAFLGLHKRNPLLAAVLLDSVPLAGRHSSAGGFLGQVQPVCRRARRFGGPGSVCPGCAGHRLSAVSLYYYLQVLKRAYVMKPVDEV
jgi:NADH-quinone oxidoreductase subunit N